MPARHPGDRVRWDVRHVRRGAQRGGGDTGNPAIFPPFDPPLPDDVLVVNINPALRDEVPISTRGIESRINEISINSSILRELRAIDFVQRLIGEGRIKRHTIKHMLIHMVADDALTQQLSVATRLYPSPQVMHQLRAADRTATERFLDTHFHR